MTDFSAAKSLFKKSRAAVLSLSLVVGGGAALAQSAKDDSQITGVVLSYGGGIMSWSPEPGSGVYMPADSEIACKNAGIAKYIASNSGGIAKSAWALCLGKENKPLRMYACDDNGCKLYKDYSDKGYSPSPK